ncbi:MAG TPA: hypothetical protein ENH55_13465 [Aurantimonas coralicida]|uniref:Uncharacterized protein n=2 Tax=root TaxID=1 RepID=A0A9C9ND74_9HYPH|nr:hypothetical protein [Aurantimonas coralicida]HET99631.1 hypothetical protein [Aurantimonas coralicida]
MKPIFLFAGLVLIAMSAPPAHAQSVYQGEYAAPYSSCGVLCESYDDARTRRAIEEATQQRDQREMRSWSQPGSQDLAPLEPLTPNPNDYGYDQAPAYQ